MQIGLVDVYANHGVLVIANKLEFDADVTLRDQAAAVSTSHILLATRGQDGLVRVRLWNGIAPRVGAEVVAATLENSGQYLLIFDIEKIGVHYFASGRFGTIPIRVSVDDPGNASRVDVLIGEGGEVRELTTVEGHPLFPVTVAAGADMGVADELGLILSGHDLPLSRLAAALKLIAMAPVARAAILDSRISQVVEWSRWLIPQQPIDHSGGLGRLLRSGIASLPEPTRDAEVLDLAERVFASLDSRV